MTEKEKYDYAAKLISKGYLVHCTNAEFDKFDKQFIQGGRRAKEGYGFYFTDMPYKPITYGDIFKIIKKDDFNWLNTKDKIDTNLFFDDSLKDKIAELNYQLDYCRNNREFDYLSSEIQKCKDKLNSFDKELIDYVKLAISEGAETFGNL